MIKRVISCLVLCGIILASPISAQALSDHQPDSISENTSEDSETLRRIVDGPVIKYITFANSTPIEFFKYTNVDGKTSLRISFTETGGPSSVFVTVQQKLQGQNYYQNVPGGSKTLTLAGAPLTVANISSNMNTEVRVMVQWISGPSGTVTLDFEAF